MHAVQIKMARAALDLTVDQLAERAALSHTEILRLEAAVTAADDGDAGRLRIVFEQAGIEFLDEDGVRFKGADQTGGTIPLDKLNSANDE